jgi:hypothetical protein
MRDRIRLITSGWGMDSDSDNRHASMRWFYLQRVLNQSCRSDWSQIPIGLPTLI